MLIGLQILVLSLVLGALVLHEIRTEKLIARRILVHFRDFRIFYRSNNDRQISVELHNMSF